MARRKRNDDEWIWMMARFGGLVVMLGIILPPFRQMVMAIGLILIGVIVVAGIGLLAFALYRTGQKSRPASSPVDYGRVSRSFNMGTLETLVERPAARPPPARSPERPIVFTRAETASDLITQLRNIDWFQFEKVVAVVYRKQGCAVTRRGGANPDGGIDLIVEKAGVTTAIQCKQWKTWNVGAKAIREFVGALHMAGIRRGVFVTLGGYTAPAREMADGQGIELLDETALAQMLKAVDAKYDPEIKDLLNDKRKFCPKCESEMVLRTAIKGPNPGGQFWGCSTYPRCLYTLQIS